MKKLQSLLKNKTYSKIPAFKKLVENYKNLEKEYKAASLKKQKAKQKHLALKKKKSAAQKALVAADCERKLARNNKRMYRMLLKTTSQYILRWVKHYEACSKHKGALPDSPKMDEKKKKAKKDKKSKEPVAKKTKSKKTEKPLKKSMAKKLAAKKSSSKKVTKPIAKKAAPKAKPATPRPTPVPAKPSEPETTSKPVAKKAPARPAVAKPVVRKAPARTAPPKKDDLKKIEGIGPKIEQLMYAARIYTYNQIARSSVARLQGVLDKAGRRYSLADPTTWPQQARLANTGKWDELKKWQGELKGGKAK